MKIYSIPIEVVAWSNEKYPTPLRVRINLKGKLTVIKISKVVEVIEEKYCGNRMLRYVCQGIDDNNKTIQLELKFDIENTTWLLWKL